MPHALPTSLRLLSGLALAGTLTLSACGGGGGSTGGSSLPITPTPTPTPTPASGGTTLPTSVLCTSAGAPQSVTRSAMAEGIPKRVMLGSAGVGAHVPGLIEVTYERASFSRVQARPDGLDRTLDFPATDRVVQILRVDPSQEQATANRLRSSPLVKSVSFGAYRYLQSTTASSAFTNDPFFQGFAPGNVPPFYQTTATGGQWDNHVMCAANAWAYGDSNTTGRTYAGALGGTAPIAIVDTGADLTHPELAGRISYSETILNGVVTQGPAGMHDNDGHGTDVAGIAAAAGNNAFGFAGIAYAAPLLVFKVFPDPPSGGCPTSNPNCTSALGSDIGLAINHAVAHGAKVINLSLGDTSADAAEENAVAAAIAAGVVVVAASGNGNSQFVGQPLVDYPAADPGVIAVGASALDDTNPAAIGEKVASYSNYSGANSTSWGVVAPGGDPCSGSVSSACGDPDDLHWIENIYTSTAADGSSSGGCRPDPNSTSANDCRVFIAGTSQATPHVAGAASLLLSVGASASQIKSLLCSTAVPIPGGKAGCGRVNVYKAMAAAVGDPSP